VLHEDWFVLRHAQRRALRMGCTDELGSRDIGGWDAFFLKVDDIVRTARYARPSIA
jgi:hypothetical protein